MHPQSLTQSSECPQTPPTMQAVTFPTLVVSAWPYAPLRRSWTSTGTSLGGSGSPSSWAWIWPRWRSQPTMSASLNHHRGCSPGEPGVTLHRPGTGGGGGQGLTPQHLAIPLPSTLQAHVHRYQVPDLEVWGHLHRQCEGGPVAGEGPAGEGPEGVGCPTPRYP